MFGLVRSDILIVGGGAAGVAAAHAITTATAPSIGPGSRHVTVIDKGRAIGSHNLSGAIVSGDCLSRLLDGRKLPFLTTVTTDRMAFLTHHRAMVCPAVPPIRPKGSLLVSYGRLCQYLAGLCEEAGVPQGSETAPIPRPIAG